MLAIDSFVKKALHILLSLVSVVTGGRAHGICLIEGWVGPRAVAKR
jgi:hypothetical protein